MDGLAQHFLQGAALGAVSRRRTGGVGVEVIEVVRINGGVGQGGAWRAPSGGSGLGMTG